jgi:3-hydroxyisobutyrate dehydrogenase-like beta-hydroxyacid dehydrogenase
VKVGFLGAGNMGMPMLERLVATGHDVTFRARKPDVVARARAHGARPADDFVDRAVVCVCGYSDEQLREVGPALLASMTRSAVLVNHTTCSPTTVVALAGSARPLGIGVLDAAISGGPDDIRAGRLTLLVGGDAAVLDAARPALAAYGDPIIPVGRVGDGQRVKLVNNALFGAQVRLVADAERLAAGLGVDPARALDAITHCSADSAVLRIVVALGSTARMRELAGHYIDKDVAVVKQVAHEVGADLGRLDPGAGASAVE